MKKILLVSLLLLALVFSIVACQNDEPAADTTVAETTAAEEPTAAPTEAEETTAAEEPTEAPATTATPETTQEPETTKKPIEEKPTEPEETEPETEPDPNAPAAFFDADALNNLTGATQIDSIVLSEDGKYITITPSASDPHYYPLGNPANITGSRYVAIKYRTANAEGTSLQIYIGTGTLDNDNDMLKQPIIGDGEWHVAIFDAMLVNGQAGDLTGVQGEPGSYDGSTVTFFRLDAMECDYILDNNGQAQKDEAGVWMRNPLPEGAYIDIEYVAFFDSVDKAMLYESQPAYVATPEILSENFSNTTTATLGDGFVTLTGTGGDGWVMAYNNEAGPLDAKVALLVYRTTEGTQGEFFAGSGGGPVGGSEAKFNYNTDGAWHSVIADLSGLSDMSGALAYVRYDYFFQATDRSIDVKYIALFDTVAQAEAYYAFMSKTPDTTLSFKSDIASQTTGTAIDATDLSGFWQMNMPTGGSNVIDFNGQPAYEMAAINEMLVMMDGAYYVKANVLESNASAALIVRGYQVMNADGLTAGNGVFRINNFYETDGNANTFGGAGIYARVDGAKLYINLKVYTPDTAQHVANKQVMVEAPGTELTIVDDGVTLHFLVDGKKYAEVTTIGTVSYDDITDSSNTSNSFAAKAIVSLADGAEVVVENTLIAPTQESHVAIASRAGSFKFDLLEIGGASAVAIPEMEVLVQRVNVATGKPVIADSVENETNIPSNATDGNESTRWGAFPTGDANMIVDLEQIYKVDTIDVFFENSVLPYTVSVSTDGETYTTIYEGLSTSTGYKTIKFEATDVRYVRFTRGAIPEGQDHNWFSIYELYVYAIQDEEETPDQPVAPATYLATDKAEYTVGEPVYVTVKGEEEHIWVAVYDKDGIPNQTPSFRWSYLEGLTGMDTIEIIPQGEPVDIMSMLGSNYGNDANPAWYDGATECLPVGEYKVLLLSEVTGETLLEVAFKVIEAAS